MVNEDWEKIEWERLKRFPTKDTFLHCVTGNQIIEEQDKINSSPNMVVVATTIFSWSKTKKVGDVDAMVYDCFIYYKVRGSIGSIVIPEDTFDESVNKMVENEGDKK